MTFIRIFLAILASSLALGATAASPASSASAAALTTAVNIPQTAVAAPTQLTLMDMVLQASPVAQAVLLLLVAMSLWSWAVIFQKWRSLRQQRVRNQQFERQFWAASSMNDLYSSSTQNTKAGAMELLFKSGMAEYFALRDSRNTDLHLLAANVERAMQIVQQREQEKAEHRLSLLASIGSTAPYIGLLGTVWGIMHAFTGFVGMEKVSLAVVAPGIAEALVATAVGLFAAIPAVLAYNSFARSIDQLLNKLDGFSNNFINILHRNLAQAQSK